MIGETAFSWLGGLILKGLDRLGASLRFALQFFWARILVYVSGAVATIYALWGGFVEWCLGRMQALIGYFAGTYISEMVSQITTVMNQIKTDFPDITGWLQWVWFVTGADNLYWVSKQLMALLFVWLVTAFNIWLVKYIIRAN